MPKGYELARIALRDLASLRTALAKQKSTIVVLDERGEDLSTARFADLLGRETAFVIGGAEGLPPDIRQGAARRIRLSSMTLAHALAQVVLVEQIYRAATLRTGHPYHRA
jgi:23S rRNA (pseudouridine1915-N3)-methyltransferase